MKNILHNIFSLKGTMSIKHFWIYSLIITLILIFLIFVPFYILIDELTKKETLMPQYMIMLLIWFIFLSFIGTWIFLAICVKRAHDLNEKGRIVYFTFILAFISIITSIIQAYDSYGYFINLPSLPFQLGQYSTYVTYFNTFSSIIIFILAIYLIAHLGFKKKPNIKDLKQETSI